MSLKSEFQYKGAGVGQKSTYKVSRIIWMDPESLKMK